IRCDFFSKFISNQKNSPMTIRQINKYSRDIHDRINYFLKVLTGKERDVSVEQLNQLFESKDIHLFLTFDTDNTVMGMMTLAVNNLSTGKHAWIEDVVVAPEHQGKGIGRKMMNFIVDFAQKEKVNSLMLISNPNRTVANNLYQSIGFEIREANVYQM